MKEILDQHIKISDSLYQSFLSKAQNRTAVKGEIIATPGKPNTRLLFLERGLMRAYRIIDGKQFTHHFFVENWFATDFQSFLTEEVSELYIEALTDVSYLVLPKAVFLAFTEKYHLFEKLARIIAEKAYLKMVDRMVDFQTQDLKERYWKLVNESPSLFQQVPQKYIASYLGVAEQSLSRIKTERAPSS